MSERLEILYFATWYYVDTTSMVIKNIEIFKFSGHKLNVWGIIILPWSSNKIYGASIPILVPMTILF